eukprot:5467626-Pyramimonas_sp.AAC.1
MSILKGKQCDYDMCDWTPVAWHTKGFTLLATELPWLICGDVNRAPEEFWRSGWAKALGAEAAITVPEGDNACFLGDAESIIDFAIVDARAEKLAKSIEPIHDVPREPHIALKIELYGEGVPTKCRQLKLPTAPPHPLRPKMTLNPNSKRRRQKTAG